jgi:hypothetical protein
MQEWIDFDPIYRRFELHPSNKTRPGLTRVPVFLNDTKDWNEYIFSFWVLEDEPEKVIIGPVDSVDPVDPVFTVDSVDPVDLEKPDETDPETIVVVEPEVTPSESTFDPSTLWAVNEIKERF